MWTGPVPQGASDDAVRVQRERIRGLIFGASAASQGLFGKLEENLMTKVWGYVEMDVWTYAGVLAVVKERPRWWMTLAETNTTLSALRLCGNRTMQGHPVGKLVVRAATYTHKKEIHGSRSDRRGGPRRCVHTRVAQYSQCSSDCEH